VATLSNAMDVGNPSNWVRIMNLFKDDLQALKKVISAVSYTDEQTEAAVYKVFDEFNYVVCPHTAIAWLALKNYREQADDNTSAGVFLSTAHPCKFPDVYKGKIAESVIVPEQVKALEGKPKQAVEMKADFEVFKKYLLA
jgi:threonine synthase